MCASAGRGKTPGMHFTDALLGEHAVFYALFDQIEELLDDAGSARELTLAIELVRPGLVAHAKLEDELLFPELARANPSSGPLPTMRSEHQQIDELLERIVNMDDLETLRPTISSLLELVREHFLKEEHVLLPMADDAFNEDTQNSLAAKWAQLRGVGR